MKNLSEFPAQELQKIRYVFTDIDDTLTDEGCLTAEAYSAMEALEKAGVRVIPITGRPAGWCDLIARLWPVSGVVGENGALYFRYDRAKKQMDRHYADSEQERISKRKKLLSLSKTILGEVKGAAISADQFCRETDLAIDFSEDVPRLSEEKINHIVKIFEDSGATAKVSSIHVNGWFGQYDKLTMTKVFAQECLFIDLDRDRESCVFVGDSPNDAPMFDYFSHSVGVANLSHFIDRLKNLPAYITEREGGGGFSELAAAIIESKNKRA